MGFLQRLIGNVFRDGPVSPERSGFEQLSPAELEAHLRISRYGEFTLTAAVRPSYDLRIIPTQGFRHEVYHDEQSHGDVPVLMSAISSPRLFDVFLDLLEPLGQEADVVLESSHNQRPGQAGELYREQIDLPVLKSTLWDFEDLLLNDGCTGLAILNPRIPLEVQLDEHKLIIVYGQQLAPFEEILRGHGIRCNERIRFLTEAEHVHSSSEDYWEQFQELRTRLGMDTDDAGGGGGYKAYR
jgi:hypothetical protein